MAEKVVVNKKTEVVGKVFKICKKCGRMLLSDYQENCPNCGGELEEKGVIGIV